MAGIGTKKTGYAPPQSGPFFCAHCKYFLAPDGCVNAAVIADPEVPKEHEEDGSLVAEIAPYGCCDLFEPAWKAADAKFSDALAGGDGSYAAGKK